MGVTKKPKKHVSSRKKLIKKPVKNSSRNNLPKDPLFLYSTNTWLAYRISEQYYYGLHYVWCTPFFDPNSISKLNYSVPPSSSPYELYQVFQNDVKYRDFHSDKIEKNRLGLLRGVEEKLKLGVIDKNIAEEIKSTISIAESGEFSPLIYIIPFSYVKNILKKVQVNKRAHPLSVEFIIEELPRDFFDVILGRV